MATCPRRLSDFGPWPHEAGLDDWRQDGSCSFCGSLHPDIFMSRVDAGTVELGPTDKNYKVYVKNRGGGPFFQTYRTDDATSADPTAWRWTTREVAETKFYFYHLSDEQMDRFVALLNGRQLHVGYPGHFYRLPFFLKRKDPDEQLPPGA